jgi:hypothetical protein
LAAPLPGMRLIAVQSVGVGLHDFTGFEKQQAEFVRGHARDKGFSFSAGADYVRRSYADLSSALSIGSFRRRLPVAAKIALVTAGTIAEVPGSPIPPGGSALCTMWTSMAGASFIRRTW